MHLVSYFLIYSDWSTRKQCPAAALKDATLRAKVARAGATF